MKDTMTYGQLYEKLRALGFAHRSFEMHGNPQYAFKHKTIPNALVTLPERDPSEQVEPFYMNSVLATLKAHDLLPKRNPLMT